MATLPELTELLDSELQSIMSSKYGATNPSRHVAPSNTHDHQKLPSLHYETQVTPIKRGFDGEAYVDEINYTNGSVSSIVFRKDYTLFYDVIATVGDDGAKERDQLYTAVDEWFSQYVMWKSSEDLHQDISDIRLLGTSDESRPDDAVRGDRYSVEMDFSAYVKWSDFATMESIVTEIEVGDAVREFDEVITIDDELLLDGGIREFTVNN